jgi:hypothetical protein
VFDGRSGVAENLMEVNESKLDEIVLALLYLTSFKEHGIIRAWKSHDWDALGRLCEKGLISDPETKAKSVVLSEQGYAEAQRLFEHHFGNPSEQ